MSQRNWATVAGALVVVVAGGCSKGSGTYATVSGTVMFNNSPANGAKVTLHSTVEAGGKKIGPFSATTDSEGRYLIATVGKDPGIPPGLYKVTITKYDTKAAMPEQHDQGQLDAAGVGNNTLPKDYENLNTTKLSVTLEAGKNENKDFKLTGKASGARPTGTP